MGLGKFDDKLAVVGSARQVAGRECITVRIGGPLEITAADYVPPAVVRYLLVHRDEAGEETGRHPGFAIVPDFDAEEIRWVKEDTNVPASFLDNGGKVRGIGVAVLQQSEGDAFDTFTWCDGTEIHEEKAESSATP